MAKRGRYLLSDAEIRSGVPGEYHDGNGLYLVVRSATSASFHLRYTVGGEKDKMGIGSYAKGLTLRRARELADAARALAAEGINPKVQRRADARRGATFAEVTTSFFESKQRTLRSPDRWLSPIQQHVLPKIGMIGVADLDIDHILNVLKPIWVEKPPTAKKVRSRTRQILEFANSYDERVAVDIVERAAARLGAVKHKEVSLAALPWKDAPELWKALGNDVAHLGFKFYLLTLPRVSNVRWAVWDELNLKQAVWTIPDDRMKTDVEFRSPLPWQAMPILARLRVRSEKLRKLDKNYLFLSPASFKHGVITENVWNNWCKENEWATTAHGLRSTFRDWIADNEICEDKLAENCIQHETRGKVERAYQRSDKLELRRIVMEKWAEYLTGLTVDDQAEIFEASAEQRLREAQQEGRMTDIYLNDLIVDQE